jgi:hypothetical protein
VVPHAFYQGGVVRAVLSPLDGASTQIDKGQSFDICRKCAESKTVLEVLGRIGARE